MKKDFNEWLNEIFRMRGKCSNKRTYSILKLLNFKKNFKIINVVGTNGKGSTSKFIADGLIENGYKVGLFTSPHLINFNERIQINNKEISNNDFYKIVEEAIDIFNKEEIMFFPITYIAAMKYFQNNNVDFAVIESGIGAKEDPSTIIDGDFGTITSISVDHIEWFKTRRNITVDKSYVIQRNMNFFLPSCLDIEDKKIIIKRANDIGTKLIKVNNDAKDYLERNFKIANAIVHFITNNDIKYKSNILGRTTLLNWNNKKIILDVAHNYDAIKNSLKLLERNKTNYNQVLISLSSNKDDRKMQELFKDKKIFLYEHKGFSPKKITKYNIKGEIVKNLMVFLNNIEVNTLFIGSFYLISEILKEMYDKKN